MLCSDHDVESVDECHKVLKIIELLDGLTEVSHDLFAVFDELLVLEKIVIENDCEVLLKVRLLVQED